MRVDTNCAGLLDELPSTLDVEAIRDQISALAQPYDVENWTIPLPVWATRVFDHDPAAAWAAIKEDMELRDSGKPLCIYIHVPFCSRKCGFCDCYSFALRSNINVTMQKYVGTVCRELEDWRAIADLNRSPVSTVHLGGGTPTFLSAQLLASLVECCRASFAISEETELALESTVEGLTFEMIEVMDSLGIRRLHVGVQTLDDDIRLAIGRRSQSSEVLERLARVLAMGWVVSVDLICGLPGERIRGFLSGIETLVNLGVDGFSLYELLIYPQNQRWAQRAGLAGRSHVSNYVQFLAGAQLLGSHGFRRNTFNHWANERDQNLYFTFPNRGEDCLAVGTIADGVFADFHYRHAPYPEYMRGIRSGGVGLEGGLRRTRRESLVNPLAVALMSSHIGPDAVESLDSVSPSDRPLIEEWLERRLVERGPAGALNLTASGSWFVGNMIKKMTGGYPATTLQQ